MLASSKCHSLEHYFLQMIPFAGLVCQITGCTYWQLTNVAWLKEVAICASLFGHPLYVLECHQAHIGPQKYKLFLSGF
jgi:hypothetical protein